MSRWVLSKKATQYFQYLRREHPHIHRQITEELNAGLYDDPADYKTLKRELQGIQSCRVGNHRVLYTIDKNGVPSVIDIGHRDTIYKFPIF